VPTGLAHLTQIGVTGENDALILRQCLMPRRSARHNADAGGQSAIVKRSAVRIEAAKFMKLHRRSGHYETPARVEVTLFGRCRSCAQKSDTFIVLKDSGIFESESIARVNKISRGRIAFRKCGEKADADATDYVIKIASGHNYEREAVAVVFPSAKLPSARNLL
jgi:hypothetical protein